MSFKLVLKQAMLALMSQSHGVFAYHSKCLFSPQGQFVFAIADKKKGEEERASVF